MLDIKNFINQHFLFSALNNQQKQSIASHVKLRNFSNGDFLFRMGEDAVGFYIIDRGQVALELQSERRGPLVIQTLKHNNVVGLSWMFNPSKWSFDGLALQETRALFFEAKPLIRLMELDLPLAVHLNREFGKLMLERLQATRLQLMDIYG